MSLSAAPAANLYHPSHPGTPLDVLLVAIGCVVVIALMVILPTMSRAAEQRRLRAEQVDGTSEGAAQPQT